MDINLKDVKRLSTRQDAARESDIFYSTKNIIESYKKSSAQKTPSRKKELSDETILAIKEIEEGNVIRMSRFIDLELPQ